MAVPYIAPGRTLREITVKGLFLGIILAMVLGAANAYLGLRVGLTVSASIPAAVISMAVLRLFRRSNILENNAVQTAASAGEALAAGVIFTIPALLILGYWERVDYWQTTFIALAGGVLGVLFTVPLRRALIVEAQLTFPEGIATSEVLKTGGEGKGAGTRDARADVVEQRALGIPDQTETEAGVGERLMGDSRRYRASGSTGIGALLIGGVAGLAYKFAEAGLQAWAQTAQFAVRVRDGVLSFGADLAPALLGVGFIVGIRIASLVFLGGVLGWLVGMPLYGLLASDAGALESAFREDFLAEEGAEPAKGDYASMYWSLRIRYIGVGAMLVGGLWSLWKLRRPLGDALRTGGARPKTERPARTEQEFGAGPTFFAVLGMVIPIFFLYLYATRGLEFTHSLAVSGLMALLMVVAGFFFSAVAAYMAGLVGSSNNPISGVTILTVLFGALMLLVLGVPSSLGPAATIFVAGVIACAAAIGGDNMQDLKAGYLLGSTPRKQQVMQIVGVVAAAVVIAPVLQLLHDAYTIGSSDLSAPQAGLMAAVGSGVFGQGLPYGMIAIGAALAVLLVMVDETLAARGSTFRTPVMPVAVGIYLPVGLSTPIFVGGLIAWLAARTMRRRSPAARERGLRMGILFSSGAIAGEAIVGILVAGLVVAGVAGAGGALSVSDASAVWPGLLLLAYLAMLMWYIAVRRPRGRE